jgi:DNA-binding NarL/FixJ family response regulator
MEQKTTIIIADDHPIFRQGLRQFIEKEGRFQVLAEAGDGAEAWELIQRHRPQIALMDFGHAGNGRLWRGASGAGCGAARFRRYPHHAQRRNVFQ